MKITNLVLAILMIGSASAIAQTKLNPDQFESQLSAEKDAQLLDVRTPKEYEDGHLKSSENINFKDPDFANRISKLDKNKPVYVYCLSGGRSAAAAKALKEEGFSNVYDMDGGYLKWSSAGKAVEGGGSSAAGMSKSDFQKVINSDRMVLVDFYAPWCAPCVKMLPTIKKLTKAYAGKARIQTINYDENKGIAKELGIEAIPAFLVYKNGKLVTRKDGLTTEAEFRKMIEKNM